MNPNRLFYLVALLLLIIPVGGRAITLDEAIQEALAHSQEIKIAEYEMAAVNAQGDEIVSFTLPQISIEAGHMFMGADKENPLKGLIGKEPEGIDTSSPIAQMMADALMAYNDQTIGVLYPEFEIPDQQTLLTLKFSQVLFAGGNVWNSWRLKKGMATQADLARRITVATLRKDVKTRFNTVLFKEAYLKILKDRVSQGEDELNDAKGLMSAGLVTSLDLRYAKLKINMAINSMKEAEVEFRNAMIDFNSIIGRTSDKPLLMPDGVFDRGGRLSEKIALLKKRLADESLLAVQALQRKRDLALINEKMAKGEFFPKVALIGGVEYTDKETTDPYTAWSAGAQLSWDLFSGGATRAKKVNAFNKVRSAEEELALTKKETGNLISKLAEQAKILNQRIVLHQEAVSLAAENYQDARSQYRAGTLTQTQMGEFHLAYSEARFGLVTLYFMERGMEIEVEAQLEE